MLKNKTHFLLFLLALLTGVVGARPVSFGLFGDTPYNRWEREQLPDMMADMDREQLAFVVHVGDIKSGSSECSDEVLKDIQGVFQASKTPLVYVPGDNEWTDCHRKNNGAYDPQERLDKLRELFFSGEVSLGQRVIPLERQSRNAAFANYRENVRWQAAGVMFVGLNLPGSENNYAGTNRGGGPVQEFVERSAANHLWLSQAFAIARAEKLAGVMVLIQANPEFEDQNNGKAHPGYQGFLHQLRFETQVFGKPVVLVHGDSHRQQINQPMIDEVNREVVVNFTRVETFGSPFMGWIKASVDADDPQVFRFSPRPWRIPVPKK